MSKADILNLVNVTYAPDSIGQIVKTEMLKQIFCDVGSVTRSEFFAAGETGIRPQYVVTVPGIDYDGQEEAELGGKRYMIYRSYTAGDNVELYLATRAGV